MACLNILKRVKVDSTIQSIIEKRKRLGWTKRILAEKSNVPYSALLRIEKGIGYWEDYVSLINSCLKRAISEIKIKQDYPFLQIEKSKQIPDNNKLFTKTNEIVVTERMPIKKKYVWAARYQHCIRCGCSDKPHIARGLCRNCYDKYTENRHKDIERIKKYGGSSQILTMEYLIDNYLRQQKSLSDIARETNCSRQYVHKKIKEYRIPLRDKSIARIIAQEKGKVIRENVSFKGKQQFITLENIVLNEKFFSSWSAEMAYVLGVIYTDGNLLPRGGSCKLDRFSLSQKEPEILTKVSALMECNATIHYREEHIYENHKAGALYWFSIAKTDVYNDLLRLGLKPNKSLTMKFPDMPKEFIRHFIRGCWDGDGSVYIEKKINKIRASYVSGSLEFVESMIRCLVNVGFSNKTIHHHKNKNRSSYFGINGPEVPIFYHYLYDDVTEDKYLKRKFDLFRLSLELNTRNKDSII